MPISKVEAGTESKKRTKNQGIQPAVLGTLGILPTVIMWNAMIAIMEGTILGSFLQV